MTYLFCCDLRWFFDNTFYYFTYKKVCSITHITDGGWHFRYRTSFSWDFTLFLLIEKYTHFLSTKCSNMLVSINTLALLKIWSASFINPEVTEILWGVLLWNCRDWVALQLETKNNSYSKFCWWRYNNKVLWLFCSQCLKWHRREYLKFIWNQACQ